MRKPGNQESFRHRLGNSGSWIPDFLIFICLCSSRPLYTAPLIAPSGAVSMITSLVVISLWIGQRATAS